MYRAYGRTALAAPSVRTAQKKTVPPSSGSSQHRYRSGKEAMSCMSLMSRQV